MKNKLKMAKEECHLAKGVGNEQRADEKLAVIKKLQDDIENSCDDDDGEWICFFY